MPQTSAGVCVACNRNCKRCRAGAEGLLCPFCVASADLARGRSWTPKGALFRLWARHQEGALFAVVILGIGGLVASFLAVMAYLYNANKL